jgi:SOS-response transcriptional repressor LexA
MTALTHTNASAPSAEAGAGGLPGHAPPEPPYPATARQMDLLRFIVGYQEASGGVAPSRDDMCRGLGFVTKSNAGRLLDGLEERGWVRLLRNRARAIDVVHAPPIPRSPDGAPLYAVPLPIPAHGGELADA